MYYKSTFTVSKNCPKMWYFFPILQHCVFYSLVPFSIWFADAVVILLIPKALVLWDLFPNSKACFEVGFLSAAYLLRLAAVYPDLPPRELLAANACCSRRERRLRGFTELLWQFSETLLSVFESWSFLDVVSVVLVQILEGWSSADFRRFFTLRFGLFLNISSSEAVLSNFWFSVCLDLLSIQKLIKLGNFLENQLEGSQVGQQEAPNRINTVPNQVEWRELLD